VVLLRLLKVIEVVIVEAAEDHCSCMSPCTYHFKEYNREALIQNVWDCCYCVYQNVLSHIFARGLFSFEVGQWVSKCERSGLKKKPTNVFHRKLRRYCVKARTYLVRENPSSTGSVLTIRSIRKIRSTVRRYSGSESCSKFNAREKARDQGMSKVLIWIVGSAFHRMKGQRAES
jgi:hypothetical protein